MKEYKAKDATEKRVIRVFVSSTFRDMQAERDELAKFIFPQLRKLCEQRGVTWGEVDLRWGITDEQSAEGKVLPICLDEIRRCRPYFIGLLGERYGWVPEAIPPELVEREPWLAEHLDHSVTELEILHGVLNNPEMAEHAFFYYRDPAHIQTLPKEQQPDYCEMPTAAEIEQYGKGEASHRAETRRGKLAALKERIRSSGFPLREDYRDPKQLGEWVLQDLAAVIEELYPEGSQPEPLDKEAADHEIFARSRAQVYVDRQTYFDQLDTHARGDGPPLVILGESGSGKSALLANWARRYRTDHPDELLLMHFTGATPASTDWVAMLRRILGEFKRKFGIQEEIPTKPDALRSAFANWLHRAAAQGRVVLVLDALNQLEDRDGAPDLVWMPPVIPENVRIFLSTLPGRPLDELNKRGWPTLMVEPLKLEERKQLIHEYLALFTKELSPVYTEQIAGADQSQNPLFLRILLDELRLFGVHERLGERIETYLKAPGIPALYELILERCEQDYEHERPGLVRDAMSLLWAARRGLSEAELMELLGGDGLSLPRARWSPLYLALERSLLSREGLIGFFHDHLRQAVQNRYLPDQPMQRQAHLRLADYFEAQSGTSSRRLDELPWQLARAGEWQRLYTLLGDLEFFTAVWDFNPFEIKAYWAQVELSSSYRMLDAYHKVIGDPSHYQGFLSKIGVLLNDTGHTQEALGLQTFLVEYYRKGSDLAHLALALRFKGGILYMRGDLDGAMVLYKEAEHIVRELGNKVELQGTLNNEALILQLRGDLNGAMVLHKEAELICRELGNKAGLHKSLSNQAVILKLRGDLDGAMALQKESERICRELGDKEALQYPLGNQAEILKTRGDLDGAMALAKEVEYICRELGDKQVLHRTLGTQANILQDGGDLNGAMMLYEEEERICRELGNPNGLAITLINQAETLAKMGKTGEADRRAEESLRIAQEHGYRHLEQHIISFRNNLDNSQERESNQA